MMRQTGGGAAGGAPARPGPRPRARWGGPPAVPGSSRGPVPPPARPRGEPARARELDGLARVHDAELVAVLRDDAHLGDAYPVVDARGGSAAGGRGRPGGPERRE